MKSTTLVNLENAIHDIFENPTAVYKSEDSRFELKINDVLAKLTMTDKDNKVIDVLRSENHLIKWIRIDNVLSFDEILKTKESLRFKLINENELSRKYKIRNNIVHNFELLNSFLFKLSNNYNDWEIKIIMLHGEFRQYKI